MSNKNTTDIKAVSEQPYLTVADTCRLLNASRRTVYRLIARGLLRAPRLSYHVTVVCREDIEAMPDSSRYAVSEREAAKGAPSPKSIRKDNAAKDSRASAKAGEPRSVKGTVKGRGQRRESCCTLADAGPSSAARPPVPATSGCYSVFQQLKPGQKGSASTCAKAPSKAKIKRTKKKCEKNESV